MPSASCLDFGKFFILGSFSLVIPNRDAFTHSSSLLKTGSAKIANFFSANLRLDNSVRWTNKLEAEGK